MISIFKNNNPEIEIKVELLNYRIYGQPKIKKPPVLKGIKPTFNQSLNKSNRKCQVFIVEEDIIVYFFDLFSKLKTFPYPEDMGLPTSKLAEKYPEQFTGKMKNKFVYPDAWCTIFNRNEGYVRFCKLLPLIKQTTYTPSLIYNLSVAFCKLSLTDNGFSPEHYPDNVTQRTADYDRFINDMVIKIKLKINSKEL